MALFTQGKYVYFLNCLLFCFFLPIKNIGSPLPLPSELQYSVFPWLEIAFKLPT